MYINFNYLKSKGIDYGEIIKLQILNQARVEDLSSLISNLKFPEYILSAYTTTLKNGELRLSKEGKELLDAAQIPNITDNDIKLGEYLIKRYLEEGKVICSKNKISKLIAWFRSELNITHEELLKIIQHYLSSDDGEYNKKLEYLFFKPANAYEKPNLQSSRLYQYIEKVKYENN